MVPRLCALLLTGWAVASSHNHAVGAGRMGGLDGGISTDVDIPFTSAAFAYEGRFDLSGTNDQGARADWPCSQIRFGVSVAAAEEASPLSFDVVWTAVRVRVNATVWRMDGTIAATHLLQSKGYGPFGGRTMRDMVEMPSEEGEQQYLVTLRKLTQGCPYGTGVGMEVLADSVMEFHGLSAVSEALTLSTPAAPKRAIEWIGASDTAGYCVDGTSDLDGTAKLYLEGWLWDNCDMASPGRLASMFDAQATVVAQGGSGLTQNANARIQLSMGKYPMPPYWENRTLETAGTPRWDFSRARQPDLVVISLGGNDFNHQHGNVPSNETFNAAYIDFVTTVLETYPESTVLSVCGQGSPAEASFDPDNNRCSPCPHVEAATDEFWASAAPELAARVHYKLVPCDGSVVVGDDDIGCNGHKNQLGQAKVAAFLAPTVESIMGWEL